MKTRRRPTQRTVDQFRVILFQLENGKRVPEETARPFVELGWLEASPVAAGGYAITHEGIRRRHFD